MRTILEVHSERCVCPMSVYLANEEQMFSLVHIRVLNLISIKALKKQTYWFQASMIALIKQTYWFQLVQRAHSACPHVIELHGDFPFRGDACHRAFSKFIMNHLSTQSQATVYATNHSQDCHQSSHLWILSVREVVIQHSLTKNNKI